MPIKTTATDSASKDACYDSMKNYQSERELNKPDLRSTASAT